MTALTASQYSNNILTFVLFTFYYYLNRGMSVTPFFFIYQPSLSKVAHFHITKYHFLLRQNHSVDKITPFD